jgi:hypothetical protein
VGRGARLVLVVAIGLLALGVIASRTLGRDDPLGEARSMAADDGGFESATRAGVTLTKISERLESAGDRCLTSRTRKQSCDAFFAAAGYSRVSAVGILSCTAPGIFDARATLRDYLERLAGGFRGLDTPPVVRC